MWFVSKWLGGCQQGKPQTGGETSVPEKEHPLLDTTLPAHGPRLSVKTRPGQMVPESQQCGPGPGYQLCTFLNGVEGPRTEAWARAAHRVDLHPPSAGMGLMKCQGRAAGAEEHR